MGSKYRISVFGLGPVGLATAVCFAKKGLSVVGIDPDKSRLEEIRERRAPYFEPNLDEYLKEVIKNETFMATDDYSTNAQSDFAFITVGTPSNEEGTINLASVKDAARMIGGSLNAAENSQLVVVKSTVTPGTARNTVKPVLEAESGKTAGIDFGLCSNPEFLREGSAVYDAQFPDRIVIGSDDTESIRKLEALYREIHTPTAPPILKTTHENAELIKYANNAFLAMKVSYINCIANIAEHIPYADVRAIAQGIGLDNRIGPQFLNAGLGWGGSCFPKDLNALIAYSKRAGYVPELIEAVVEINRTQARKALEFALDALGSLEKRKAAILGLAFKPYTNDMREAVSIPVINSLLAKGASVTAYDPAAIEDARKVFGNTIGYAKNSFECIEQADCCVIVTEWDEFKRMQPKTFLERMRQPIVIDGRRIYDAAEFLHVGIKFYAIGLGPAK